MQIGLPQVAFSPAKMVYIGYILLSALKVIDTNIQQFIYISAVFFFAQVIHDDFLRIVLNQLGEGLGNRLKRWINR